MERNRKIDLNKIPDDQAKAVEETLSKKMTEIINKALEEANKYLNVYGMEAKMLLEITEKKDAPQSLSEGKQG